MYQIFEFGTTNSNLINLNKIKKNYVPLLDY